MKKAGMMSVMMTVFLGALTGTFAGIIVGKYIIQLIDYVSALMYTHP